MTTQSNAPTTATAAVATYTGTTINGVQQQAEVLMARHNPSSWPTLDQGLALWEAQTKALDAKDFEVNLRDVTMNPETGGLYNRAKGQHPGITPTHTALGHLVSYTKSAPTANVENLEFYPPAVRALMLQAQIDQSPVRKVFLRTAVKGVVGGEQSRAVRAVVSDKHSQEHGDDLALIDKLRKLSLPGAVLRVVKEWDYTHAEVVIPNKVVEVRRGVVIQARINIKNSETKGGSFETSVGSMNLVCLNGMVGAGNGTTISVRHMGDIRYKMLAGVQTVINLMDDHLHEFSEAYRQELPVSQADAIGRVVKRFKLPETTGTALGTLWSVDGELGAGHTVAGLANALTRHAQSLSVERALEVEAVAGKVISQGLSAFL